MGYDYRSALIVGWEAEELREEITKAENEKRYDYVDKIYGQLNETDFIFDINENFLYVGIIVSDCGIYDCSEAIFMDGIDFKKFAQEAQEQVKALKEYWEPTEPPTLIHFCYVR